MQDIHKDRLEILSNDEVTLQAIRVAFEERIEKERPEIKEEDDTALGQKYRAYKQAKNILDEVMKDLEGFKNTKVDSENYNKGK